MSIITEEMRYRKKVVEYAMKYENNAKAARKYHANHIQVKRWRDKYNGSWDSLRNKSTKPHSHPNQHSEKELEFIKKTNRRYGHEGLAQVYVECKKEAIHILMTVCVNKLGIENGIKQKKKQKRTLLNQIGNRIQFLTPPPGEKVQIDIKYVPRECLKFDSFGIRYYQITALDEYSRKRFCEIVDEKSVAHTANFVLKLEENIGFKIDTIQMDNGREFTNDPEVTEKETLKNWR